MRVLTAARKVKIYHPPPNGANLDTSHFFLLPPSTEIEVTAPSLVGQNMLMAHVVNPLVPPCPFQGAGNEGIIGRSSVHRAYVRTINANATGVKYGASSKYGEKEEESGTSAVPSGQYSRSLKGNRVDGGGRVLGTRGALGFSREQNCACGQGWADHKILETTDVRDRARQIAARANLNRMIGVIRVQVRDDDPGEYFYAASGANNHAQAAHIPPALQATVTAVTNWPPPAFLDCSGEIIFSDEFLEDTKRNFSELKCAAPRLIQAALHSVYSPANGGGRVPHQADIILGMSEVWSGADSAIYKRDTTADSCNLCRATFWRFLCGYTNQWKKSLHPRPAAAPPPAHVPLPNVHARST